MSTHEVLALVMAERARQDVLVASGRIPWNCCEASAPDGYKLAVLTEEVGEVAREVLERPPCTCTLACIPQGLTGEQVCRERGRAELLAELVQVAAVAVAWAEAL